MSDFQLILSYEDYISKDFFDDFLGESEKAQVPLELRKQIGGPKMGIEWLISSAVVLYVTKPFIDEILKRAAKDFGDVVYPKIQAAIAALATKVLAGVGKKWRNITASGELPREGKSAFFSIVSVTKDGVPVKFVFEEGLFKEDYEAAVGHIWGALSKHHLAQRDDPLRNAPIDSFAGTHTIYMIFDTQKQVWEPIDVEEEIHKERLKSR